MKTVLKFTLLLSLIYMRYSKVIDGTIVGAGRIGTHLFEINGRKDKLISSRTESFVPSTGPIYICTRNNDLDKIVDSTPLDRRSDLVFLQNGILTDFLTEKGLQDNTQALIYYAVSKKGESPIDGITDLNPDGLTAVTGKWAEDFSERMKTAGLSCRTLDPKSFEIAMVYPPPPIR
jgi:hypothetical protein